MTFQRKVLLLRLLLAFLVMFLTWLVKIEMTDYVILISLVLFAVSIYSFRKIGLNSQGLEIKSASLFGLLVQSRTIPFNEIIEIEKCHYTQYVNFFNFRGTLVGVLSNFFPLKFNLSTTRITTTRASPFNVIEFKYDLDFHFDIERKVLSKRKEHDENK